MNEPSQPEVEEGIRSDLEPRPSVAKQIEDTASIARAQLERRCQKYSPANDRAKRRDISYPFKAPR